MTDKTFIPANASEAEVADTIVNARKSWRTVKGKSEVVWPPHLERSLVKALLQYKPTDSRYARALGRFPKRNRFISDSIYVQTGVRRTPKQVGSRLQQLKDVNCGKRLLEHAANTSLGPASGPCQATLGSFNEHQNISINVLTDVSEDGSLSPTSLFPHLRTPFSHGSGNGEDGASLASPHSFSFYSSVSAYGSLPITPQIRRLDISLQYDPSSSSQYKQQLQRCMAQRWQACPATPLMRFSGCLARPKSITQVSSDSASGASGVACKAIWEREPIVTFTAREVVAAQCVVRVLTSDRMVLEETHHLVCVAMPAVSASVSPSRSLAVSDTGSGSCGDDDKNEDDCNKAGARSRSFEQFVYRSRLVSGAAWQAIRCDHDASRYTIMQDLVYQFDTPAAPARETFLSIVYHFVPTPAAVQQQSAMDPGMMIPTKPVRGAGSTSPASSCPSSRSSGSSESSSVNDSPVLTQQQHQLFLMHHLQNQHNEQQLEQLEQQQQIQYQQCFDDAYSMLAHDAGPESQHPQSQISFHTHPQHSYMQPTFAGLTSERGASAPPSNGRRNHPTATDVSGYPISVPTQDSMPVDRPFSAGCTLLYDRGGRGNLSTCNSEVGSMEGVVGAPSVGHVDFATAFSAGTPILR